MLVVGNFAKSFWSCTDAPRTVDAVLSPDDLDSWLREHDHLVREGVLFLEEVRPDEWEGCLHGFNLAFKVVTQGTPEYAYMRKYRLMSVGVFNKDQVPTELSCFMVLNRTEFEE